MSRIRLTERTTDPETPSKDGLKKTGDFYTKEVGGVLRPFIRDSDGNITDFKGQDGLGITVTTVANILDPSTEFGSVAGTTPGDMRLAVEVLVAANKTSIYVWDTTSVTPEDIPRVINGSAGQWRLVATTEPDLLVRNATGTSIDNISAATFKTVQDMIDTMQSVGVLSGAEVTDNGDGTIAISAGTGVIRVTDSDNTRLKFFDIAANPSIAIAEDGNLKFVYIEYNGGSPQYVVAVERADLNTNIQISKIFREGLEIHIHQALKFFAGNTNFLVSSRLFETEPFERVSGASISETGVRNFAVSAGAFWECLNKFTTEAFNSAGVDNYDTYHRDGVGGFTKTGSVSQIDNLQYDDGSGVLATLANNQYGVHWVFLESDSNIVVIYGLGSYTLIQAQNAGVPASLPKRLETHGRLVGKIIIQKSAASFTSIESPFDTEFKGSLVTEHNNTTGLQGGTADQYFHLTSAEYARFQASQAEKTARSALAALAIDFAGDSIKTKVITANSIFTFAGITAATLDRVITLELTGNFAITLPASVKNAAQIQSAYDGTKVNWIFFNVVDAVTPQVIATLIRGD